MPSGERPTQRHDGHSRQESETPESFPVFSFKLITVVDFYRLHVCVPSKFLLKPNAECDGTGRWG